ncbi:uncharacterized protein LOC129788449 [Lutzomyia longipalpis]|uniref:uncharacterized protein LOC129788449 n=1 Tax=Lutzomyia longipalpis TaxID=7200 RepID=UPI002483E4A2|nr:uncharacterized protein LOC129788449 [Lutzomyia longipalpis]
MPLLDHFCFCCSVRLGTIFTGFYASLSSAICLYYLGILDEDSVDEYLEEYDVLEQVQDNFLIHRIVSIAQEYLTLFLETCIILISLHLITCVLLIVGAIRLYRYFLIPFMILNMGKIIFFLGLHVIAMMALKKQLPLGELIATTCAGGFYILFLLYMWSTSVALYQQINLIHSEKYRRLYGELHENNSLNSQRNFLQVRPMEFPDKRGKKERFRTLENDSNMLYRDFMSIYSRKRY